MKRALGMGFFLAIAVGLASCVEVTMLSGPDGRPAYGLDCGTDRTACLKKAGELCPTGYGVVDDASRTVAVPVEGSILLANQEHLTVSCR